MNVVSSEDRVVFVEQCTCAIVSGGIRDEERGMGGWKAERDDAKCIQYR